MIDPLMNIRKAVITAAGQNQRTLPLQTLIDRDGTQKSVLRILIDEVLESGIEEICVVLCPGDETIYAKAAGEQSGHLRFLPQTESLGYGHAIYCAREFIGHGAFLHLVGDHVYVGSEGGCAKRLVAIAQAEACSVSAVQPTREGLLSHFGAVGGQRFHGRAGLYRVETVIEKPTPTEAEQLLTVAGLRAGHYLCFFGMHVLTPAVMEILGRQLGELGRQATLSSALAELAAQEQYLAVQIAGHRYDLGAKYGQLIAQLALALSGRESNEILAQLVELLAQRTMQGTAN
ncbi:MAG TPA: sugar phosphate nucleotidyltransferase [Candidatus Eremiobacteraceae bacterium]|nr:sugar phosphate nucleotidyltransferase [Candidatus Eremiobacteraceae bacterium]